MPRASKDDGALQLNIAEVSDLTGLKPHVLRYWETEFRQLQPMKRSGQRVYLQKDLDVIQRLKRLLYDEEYTISGARKKLEQDLKDARREQLPLELDLKEAEVLGTLMKVRRQVHSLREQLSKPLESAEEAQEAS
jgi:DNA-binding transcriptional MerR regulator